MLITFCFVLHTDETEEHQSLVQGLALIKETISQVNDQVCQYEKASRLREIGLRLEARSQGRLKNGQVFRRADLISGDSTLLHEGTVIWKTSGKQKGWRIVDYLCFMIYLCELHH